MDQEVKLTLKAVNQASAEMAKIATDVKNLERATRSYGTATPAAKAAASQFLDTLKATRGAAGDASEGLGSVNRAAKDLAKGGLAEVLSQVPIVGGSLSKLASGLGGFSLVAGGVIGAGIGIVKMLSDMDTAATKNLTSITALSEAIGTRFKAALLDSQKTLAEARSQRTAAIELGYQKELAAAEAARAQTVATAKAELDEVNASWFSSFATRQQAQAKFQTAVAAAENESASVGIEAQARKTAAILALLDQQIQSVKQFEQEKRAAESEAVVGALDIQGKQVSALQASMVQQEAIIRDSYAKRLDELKKLGLDAESYNEQRVAAEATMQAKLVTLEQQSADKRRQIIEQSTTAALGIFEKLGSQFGKLTEKLQVAQFVQQSAASIKTLQGFKDAIASGDETLRKLGITERDVDDGIKQLTQDMKDAVSKGVIPMKEATAALTTETEELGNQTRATGNALVDMYLAAARAALKAEDAAKAGGGGVPTPSRTGNVILDTGVSPSASPSGPTGNPILDYGTGSLPSFAAGGVVPGPPGHPRVVVAHGGEEYLGVGAARRSSGPGVSLNFHPGAITVPPGMNERDARAFVQTLAGEVAKQIRRRG